MTKGKGTRASADTQTRAIETSPEWRKKQARKRRREQAEWESRSGPVEVRRIEPS